MNRHFSKEGPLWPTDCVITDEHLFIKDMQIITTMRCNLTPGRWLFVKKKERKKKNVQCPGSCGESASPAHRCGDTTRCSCGKQCAQLRKLKVDLPQDPAISLLGICPKSLKSGTLLVVVLLTRAKVWRPAKCPWTDEWL